MERTERVTFAHIITASLRIRAFTSEKVVENNLEGTRKKMKRKSYAKASEKAHGRKVIIWSKGKTIGLNTTIDINN